MLLRTRVTIIVGLALLVLGGGLVFAGHQRDKLADARFADATLTGQETFWHKLVENVAQRLEGDAVRMAGDARLIQAMAAHDNHQAAVALGRIMPKASGRGQEVRAAATAKNGIQLATTLDRLSGTLLDGGALAHVMETGQTLLGVQVAEDRSIWIAATAPVRLGGEPVGAVTLALPLDEAVREFKASTGADLLVVNRSGGLAAGTNQIFWPQVQQEVQLGKRRLFVFETGSGHFMAVGTTKLYDGMRRYGGTLVTARDITGSHTREHDIAVVSAAAAGLFFGMIVLGFYLYLQHSFDPLKEAIQVLEAMSRGDTSVSIRGRGGDDEIGRIASTVELFRAGMIEQELQDVRRERKRRWQERFVRNQLAELCDALDEPARTRALARLDWSPGDDGEAVAAGSAMGHNAQLGAAPLALAAIVAEIREAAGHDAPRDNQSLQVESA